MRRECICPICGKKAIKWKKIEGYFYFTCKTCKSIFIDPKVIERIDFDNNFSLREYNEDYWKMELKSSWSRSWGVALARMAEVIYYARIPVNAFLDIGGGPGFFLDAVEKYLPEYKDKFFSVEKFPPEDADLVNGGVTSSPNYFTTGYEGLPVKIQAGMCIEVIEHLTPKMFKGILTDISMVSDDGAIYIFNSGMPEYVENEDPSYMDPLKRGHILSYSLEGVQILAEQEGFTAIPIPGKTWAFVLEYHSQAPKNENITDRIWSALPENLALLESKSMGSVLKVLGLETARAYR